MSVYVLEEVKEFEEILKGKWRMNIFWWRCVVTFIKLSLLKILPKIIHYVIFKLIKQNYSLVLLF